MAWVQTACPNVRYSFIPAIGIGQLCLPLPAGVDWRPPEPGPIARRIGLRPFDDAVEIGPATLTRFAGGGRNPEREPIRLVKVSLPGILVPEAVAACLNAHGPARSVEWRPFVRSVPSGRVAQRWQPRREGSAEGDPGIEAFSIVEGRLGASDVNTNRRGSHLDPMGMY